MLIKKVENYINEYRLIEQSDHVIVGLSGGADSVSLLLLLYELSKKMGFEVSAAHINHMIRGAEADGDEQFVRTLCEGLGVKLFVSRIDVPAYAKEHGLSEEEAGRNIRYKEFRKIAKDLPQGHAKIAVAHNKDDQVETILFNIIRGTSLKGLSGMKPVNGDVIRPLLDVSRAEIEQFLRERGEDYRTDSTNLEDEYTRNKIRNKIIPLIKEINPGFGDRLIELGDAARIADEDASKEAIINKAAYLAITELTGTAKDITSKHVKSVSELDHKQVGSKVDLPYGVVAKKEYEGVKLYKKEEINCEDKSSSDKKLKKLKKALKKARVLPYNGEEIPNMEYKKWLDYDKIKGKLIWRYRAKGDRISLGESCHKKLKDHMIDMKIPKEERDKVPLLTDGKDIVWVLGGRIGSDYKVTEDTKNIIIIDVGESYGDNN